MAAVPGRGSWTAPSSPAATSTWRAPGRPACQHRQMEGGRKRRSRKERRDTEAVIAGGRLMALLLSVFPGADANPNRGRSLVRAGRRKPVGRSEQAAATGFYNSWRLVLEGQERRETPGKQKCRNVLSTVGIVCNTCRTGNV